MVSRDPWLSHDENDGVLSVGFTMIHDERINRMFRIMSSRVACSWALRTVLALAASGCGGQNDSSQPGTIDKPEEVAAVLPAGVTMETPVVADKRYGENSKTVADALASLNAKVKDGVLTAGFVGPEIHFDSEPVSKVKPGKQAKKAKKPAVVVHLAK